MSVGSGEPQSLEIVFIIIFMSQNCSLGDASITNRCNSGPFTLFGELLVSQSLHILEIDRNLRHWVRNN